MFFYGRVLAVSEERWSYIVNNVCTGPVHSAGRGTARVEIKDDLGERRHFFHFAFSGSYSRSQRYALADDQKPGPFEISWIAGPDNLIAGGIVISDSRPPREFYRVPGYDFHPATFLSPQAQRSWSMRQTLLAWQKNCQTLEVDDSNDVIVSAHVVTKDVISEMYSVTLDQEAGLLPKEYRMSYEHAKRPFINQDVQIRYVWKKWQDKYYLSSMERIIHAFRPGSDEAFVGRTRIEIVDFVPLPQIDESEFSLDGLGLSDGFIVYDAETKAAVPYRRKR